MVVNQITLRSGVEPIIYVLNCDVFRRNTSSKFKKYSLSFRFSSSYNKLLSVYGYMIFQLIFVNTCFAFLCTLRFNRMNFETSKMISITCGVLFANNWFTYSTGCDNSWAIGSQKAGFTLRKQHVLDFDHVMLWNSFCNAYNQGHLCFNSFNNSFSCAWWWHVDDRCLSSSSFLGFSNLEFYLIKIFWRAATPKIWLTELKTGCPKCSLPPLPGDTPPTTWVPYSIACCEWNVPCFPVNPWQMTFVCSVSFRFCLVDS